MADEYQILLKTLMDRQSVEGVKQATKEIEDGLDALEKKGVNASKMLEQASDAAQKALASESQSIQRANEYLNQRAEKLRAYIEDVKKMRDAAQQAFRGAVTGGQTGAAQQEEVRNLNQGLSEAEHLLDQIQTKINSNTQKMGEMGDEIAAGVLEGMTDTVREAGKLSEEIESAHVEANALNKEFDKSREKLGKAYDEAVKMNQEFDRARKKESVYVQDVGLAHDMAIAEQRARGAEAQVAKLSRTITGLRTAATALTSVGIALTAIGGGAIFGALRMVNSYADAMKAAGVTGDEMLNKWTTINEKLKMQQLELGRILMPALQPILEQVSDLLQKVIDFANNNPEVIKAGVNIAKDIAILGGIVTAVAGIVRSVAGLLEVAKFLGLGTAGKALGSAVAGQAAKLGAGFLAGTGIGGALGVGAAGAGGVGLGLAGAAAIQGVSIQEEWLRLRQIVASGLGTILAAENKIGLVRDENTGKVWNSIKAFLGLNDAVEKSGDAADSAAQAFNKAEEQLKRGQAQQIFSELQQKISDITSRYAEERADIVADSEYRITEIHRNTVRELSKLASSHSATLAKMETAYRREEAEAQADYERQRAEIIQQSGINIVKIQHDLQRDLEKMEADHKDRVYDLSLTRDALGLVREERRYNRETSERRQAANDAIREERAETQRRLAELRQRYILERQQRAQQYAQQVAEENAQYQERRKELMEAEAEQTRQAIMEANRRIMELDRRAKREVEDAIMYAEAKLKDLDQFGQWELERARYWQGLMKTDWENFWKSMKAAGGSGTRAEGGYAQYGKYLLGENGYEFVMSNASTRAAEKLIGGRLNQANLLAALVGNKKVTYNDNRRIDASIPLTEREAYKNDLLQTLADALAA